MIYTLMFPSLRRAFLLSYFRPVSGLFPSCVFVFTSGVLRRFHGALIRSCSREPDSPLYIMGRLATSDLALIGCTRPAPSSPIAPCCSFLLPPRHCGCRSSGLSAFFCLFSRPGASLLRPLPPQPVERVCNEREFPLRSKPGT